MRGPALPTGLIDSSGRIAIPAQTAAVQRDGRPLRSYGSVLMRQSGRASTRETPLTAPMMRCAT